MLFIGYFTYRATNLSYEPTVALFYCPYLDTTSGPNPTLDRFGRLCPDKLAYLDCGTKRIDFTSLDPNNLYYYCHKAPEPCSAIFYDWIETIGSTFGTIK